MCPAVTLVPPRVFVQNLLTAQNTLRPAQPSCKIGERGLPRIERVRLVSDTTQSDQKIAILRRHGSCQ